jgi:hypothetical protein
MQLVTGFRRRLLRRVLLLSTFASIVACAMTRPPAQRYVRPNTTQEQFMQDRYDCLQEAQRQSPYPATPYGPSTSCELISACLGARGYSANPQGDLAPPENVAVLCHH